MQLAAIQETLRAMGVETLGIVISPVERARLYFKYRPTRITVSADPDVTTHRAFGLPRFELTDAEGATSNWPRRVTHGEFLAVRVNPMGELPEPLPLAEAAAALNQNDGFQQTEVDVLVRERYWTQLGGHFLIDRAGIIRWAHVEADHGIADYGKFPGDKELLAAARALAVSKPPAQGGA